MSKQLTVRDHIAAAPHRSLFLAGALQGVLTLLWWMLDLAGRYGIAGSATTWVIAPAWAHAFLMMYSFFPFFIFGFLFTTYPSWMNGDKVKPREYMTTSLLMALGVILFYVGLLTHKIIIIMGIEIMLAGWGVAVYVLFRILLLTPAEDKRHSWVTSLALLMGGLGMTAYLFWIVTEVPAVLDFTRHAGVWFFLLPIVLTVSHRMIPFFSSRVLEDYEIVRPYWMLWLMLACIVAHGCLQWLEMQAYLWIVDFPLALGAFYLSYRWGFFTQLPSELAGRIAHFICLAGCIHDVVRGTEPDIYAVRQPAVRLGTVACIRNWLFCRHDPGDGFTRHPRSFRTPLGTGSFHLVAVFRFPGSSRVQNICGYFANHGTTDVTHGCRTGLAGLLWALGG